MKPRQMEKTHICNCIWLYEPVQSLPRYKSLFISTTPTHQIAFVLWHVCMDVRSARQLPGCVTGSPARRTAFTNLSISSFVLYGYA